MGSYDKHTPTYSRYSAWALISLSLLGIVGSFYKEMSLVPTLVIIVLPYALSLFCAIALLLEKKWASLPILLISIAGVLRNAWELTVEGVNQKDVFEIILFALILTLIVRDTLIASENRG